MCVSACIYGLFVLPAENMFYGNKLSSIYFISLFYTKHWIVGAAYVECLRHTPCSYEYIVHKHGLVTTPYMPPGTYLYSYLRTDLVDHLVRLRSTSTCICMCCMIWVYITYIYLLYSANTSIYRHANEQNANTHWAVNPCLKVLSIYLKAYEGFVFTLETASVWWNPPNERRERMTTTAAAIWWRTYCRQSFEEGESKAATIILQKLLRKCWAINHAVTHSVVVSRCCACVQHYFLCSLSGFSVHFLFV